MVFVVFYFEDDIYMPSYALRSSKHSTNDAPSRADLLNLSTKICEFTQASTY